MEENGCFKQSIYKVSLKFLQKNRTAIVNWRFSWRKSNDNMEDGHLVNIASGQTNHRELLLQIL